MSVKHHVPGGSTEPLNVLCLDGGGVRGLTSLYILRSIFERLSYQYSPQKLLRPCNIFDIICGTSTGGIIALMLGRLRMSTDEAIDAYIDFSRTVFGNESRATENPKDDTSTLEKWIKKIIPYDYFSRAVPEEKEATDTDRPIYDALKLEEWIKKIVSEKTGNKHTPLSDKSHPRCHTFVVAVSKAFDDSPPKLFRTYPAKGMPADNCEIWEAARATTAAVPFFEHATFGIPRSTYADDELSKSNNPSRLAIEEAESIFPSRKIGLLLSLGTGIPDIYSIPEDERKITDAYEKLLQSCHNVHEEMVKLFKTRFGEGYIRLSVNRELSNVQLNEWVSKHVLMVITEVYLDHATVKPRVKECITRLKERGEMIVGA